MTSNISNDLIHCLSHHDYVSFDINIIKIESLHAEIDNFLVLFDVFSAIFKICK